MRVAVTGADGFVGSWLERCLRERDHDVQPFVPADRATDLRDGFYWPPSLDALIHCAAIVGREAGDRYPCETASVNAGLTALLARECAARGVRFVYVSSSEVYGDRSGPLPEATTLLAGGQPSRSWLPHNLYGLSKRWGEEAARLYAPAGLQIVRLSMPYGPGHLPGSGRAALPNFLWSAMHGEPITVHRGSERSWCWIGDTVRGIALVLEAGEPGVWNIGRDDNATPMLDVATMAARLVHGDASIETWRVWGAEIIREVDPPAGFTVAKRLSTAKLRGLGWRPEVELEEGMRRTYEWLQTVEAAVPA